MKIRGFVLGSALILASTAVVHADVNSDLNTEASKMNTLASSQDNSKVVDKISSQFGDFLGADSKAVVTGLRNGTPITLTRTTSTPGSTSPGTTTTPAPTNVTINPPTGKMGYGNVFISLALAKQQLGQMGITQPTPEQLNAALVGGTFPTGTTATGNVTTSEPLPGILAMRSEHMGWGQIAHKLGFKLGPVVSGLKNANQTMTTTTTSTTSTGTTAAGSQVKGGSHSGIVSGSGKSHGNSAQGVSGKSGSSQGIVSASGKTVGSGNAYGHGKGIVTGAGQASSGNSGITTGGGHGNSSGHGSGHKK